MRDHLSLQAVGDSSPTVGGLSNVYRVFIWIISAFKLPASDRSALGEKAHRFGSCHQRLGLAAAIVTTTLFLPAVAILSFVADAETE
ncbi:hypothetical protein D3800_11990 [Microcystis aeruginosa NIES-298]|uniref:Uncharacterized protein n=1 Tax=Microcystis aeruginosa NIES-298 TaxID=449468 RepID=A0A2H6BYT9_MICAE|nr:hypothetical protein [Microcystis aeruginosa]QHU83987.1 hypothetical protein D3800_11990 [Microcystis aeruginosa NIES-298]GBD55336.1 hypothetical protein BGM30_44290 [Microcystis aeruginosa NIES-298]GBE97253.1 hypothetical protein NIES298_15010 [Microcystis aeruginosa NIES-298]